MTLESLFATVLQLSFYGTIGCGVILVCALVNYARAPRWISMTLWGLVALRLIVPFHFSSAVSLFRLDGISDLSSRIDRTLDDGGAYRTALEGSAEFDQAVAAGSPVSTTPGGSRMAYYYERENGRIAPAKTAYASFPGIGARVWIAGMALLWLWAGISYVRLKRRLRFSMQLFRGVYETDAVSSPCVVGILRPRIYLIPGLTDMQKTHILLHERMHVRYLDHIWKIVSFAVISVHWFNPFLWFMYRMFQGELEKACDERVLARLGEDKKEEYSESLLALAVSRNWKRPTPISFGEENIKGRIKRILAYQKPMVTLTVVVVILSVAGCSIFLTTAEPSDGAAESAQTSDLVEDNALPTDIGTNTPDPLPEAANRTEPDSARSDTETAPDNEPALDRTEVYDEITDNGVTFQARWGGIYRIGEDGSEEQLYPIFAGTEPQMTVFEDTLYFRTDQSYYDGALDWSDNTIRWIDLNTGKTGDLPFIRQNQNIAFFAVYEGLAVIRYSTPDVTDTIMLYTDEAPAFNGKNIAQLSGTEREQLGQDTTQTVLQNPCTLVNISHRTRDRNTAYLDMDGDGTAEEITLEPSQDPENMAYRDETDPLSYFRLQVGNAKMENWGENLSNTLWAVSLDGQSILLVLYEDGPSADPYTRFYRYQNDQIIEAGGFADDIRLCGISPEGIITSAIRQDVVQTDWITVRWQFGENGMLEEIPQDLYEFQNPNWVNLSEDLPLHVSVGSTETFVIPSSQSLRFLQTSADWRWVLAETGNGAGCTWRILRSWIWGKTLWKYLTAYIWPGRLHGSVHKMKGEFTMRTKNVPILLLAITGTLLIGGCEKQTADSTPGTVPDLTSSSEAPIQVDILSETSVDPLPEQASTTDPTSQDRTQTAPQTDNATPEAAKTDSNAAAETPKTDSNAAAAPKTDNTAAETPKTDSSTAAETVTVTKAFQPNEGWTSDFFFQIPQDWSYTIDEDTIEWGFLIQVSGQEDASLCIYGRYGTVNVEPFYTDAPTDFETSSGLKGRFYQNIHTDEDGSSYIEGDIVFDLRSYGVRFYMPENVYTEYKDTLQAVFRSIRIENTFTE